MAHAKSVTDAGRDALKEGAKTAKAGAKKVSEDAKAEANKRTVEAKSKVADKAADEAARLRAAASEMADGAPHTEAVDMAAEKIQHAADHLRNTSPGDLAGELASLARRHPVAAVSIAAVAGFAVGRFLKSTNRTQAATHTSDIVPHHIPTPDNQAPS